MIDPYVRYDYQIHNFMSFCECMVPTEGQVELNLVTSAESKEQEVEISAKLNELQSSLVQDRIVLTYTFDSGKHDRWIETDTGWRIILGRGLDIFQKPEGKFTLGLVDQNKRRCKATTISYSRIKS